MKVKVDTKKNRLYIKISGKISEKIVDELYTNVRFAVADLEPGFGAITDLTESKIIHLSGIATYKKIMDYVVKGGVNEIVRVVRGKSLVFRQLLNISSSISAYMPIYVNSLEEAENTLDLHRRNGLRFHYKKKQRVLYSTNDLSGEGEIANISTSGCLIKTSAKQPNVEEEVEITMSFTLQDNYQQEFSLLSRVVRREKNAFAVEYQSIDKVQKKKLWECLIYQFEQQVG